MSDDEIAPEMLARLGINAIAMLWAQEFNKTAIKIGYSEMDEGWLTSWFANAIENCDMMRRNPLRADLSAVTAERDKMRESLKETLAIARCNEAGDYVDRALAALEGVTEPATLWQHKKTGGIYEIVGECQIEATNTPGVLYRNISTGVTWVRQKEEFFDGRFVEMA